MIINTEYLLYTTHETSYLLPTGQARYSGKKQLELHEIGCFILEQLVTEKSLEELLFETLKAFSHLAIPEQTLINQICSFIRYCLSEGIILEHPNNQILPRKDSVFTEGSDLAIKVTNGEQIHFEIASLPCTFVGEKEIFPKEFFDFINTNGNADTKLTYYVDFVEKNELSSFFQNQNPIIATNEVLLFDTGNNWLIKPLLLEGIFETHVSYDGQTALILCDKSLRKQYISKDYPEGNPLFLAMRYPFLYAIEKQGMLAIHSSSIVYQDQVWLFSALSGTGKTTHTNLWKKLFHTPIFNGDLCVIGEYEQKVYAYGIPWCGTSRECINKILPLGGIILIKRGQTNTLLEIPEEKRNLSFFNRLLTTSYSTKDTEKTLGILSSLLDKNIFTGTLFCNTSDEAAFVMKSAIDTFLQDTKI